MPTQATRGGGRATSGPARPRPARQSRETTERDHIDKRVASWLTSPSGHRAIRRVAIAGLGAGAVGLLVRAFTHLVAPRVFDHDEHFPDLANADLPKRTRDKHGRRGDPVNVALIGTEAEIARAFLEAGWCAPGALDRKDDEHLAETLLMRRSDPDAPMSSLYLFDRPQDLAFERESGRTAGRRHHVRLWCTDLEAPDGDRRPVWIGGATFDVRAGFIVRRLTPTHHIGADIDRERQYVFEQLAVAGQLERWFHVTGLGVRVAARNATRDRYDTDGEISVGVIPRRNRTVRTIQVLRDPRRVALKNRLWARAHRHAPEPPSL